MNTETLSYTGKNANHHKSNITTNAGEIVGKMTSYPLLVRTQTGATTLKTSMENPQKNKNRNFLSSGKHFLYIFFKNLKYIILQY